MIGSTYRVQLHAGFTFEDVVRIVPYLAELGITHLYCSPYLQAHEGSTHGYDVVDHSKLNEELGGQATFDRMARALKDSGLGHIVDIVPNHVSIAGRSNSRWWDVLKHGRSSRYASMFDINWESGIQDLQDKVLVPVLGGELEDVVRAGEVKVQLEGGEPVVRYYDNVVPLTPETAPSDVEGLNRSPDDLLTLLDKQHYVLANWRRAQRHINYRRFFDINTLAALQMDEPGVFEETHKLVLRLIREGKLDGLRIDHIDGLRDPEAYLSRLSEECNAYIVVDKILEPGDSLPTSWPVEGTTGYDFLNVVGGLFVDRRAEDKMHDIYERFIGEQVSLEKMTLEKKYLIQRQIMVSDITRLVDELWDVFEAEGWDTEDEMGDYLRAALGEVIASFEVYRTYLTPSGELDEGDAERIRRAVAGARERRPHLPATLLDRIEDVLLGRSGGEAGLAFALRFQQTTGPIMAKSVEDTLFYNFNRLVSLNEVGGHPGHFGSSVADFHDTAERAQEEWPLAMLATSTHDTKRSEDVRTRIDLLSEIPDEWEQAAGRWAKIGERHSRGDLPDRNAQYLFFQTTVGAWPLSADRAVQYMQKASKEAKRYTSWIDPVPEYDEALENFVRGMLADEEFTRDLESFVAPLIPAGRASSLAQTLIKLTYPGVPDTYQGSELWDLSLVDPDNRRPVDYKARRAVLEKVRRGSPADLWQAPEDGAPKMLVTTSALTARSEHPEAFGAEATYLPLEVTGAESDRVVAFARGTEEGAEVCTVAPRLTLSLDGGWKDTSVQLPPGEWRNSFTSEEFSGNVGIDDILGGFPVALLTIGGG